MSKPPTQGNCVKHGDCPRYARIEIIDAKRETTDAVYFCAKCVEEMLLKYCSPGEQR